MGFPRLCWLWLAVGAGCAQTFPRPFTAAQLQQQWSGAALVAYLGQPDASPSVCDLRSRAPGAAMTAFMRDDLVRGMVDGRIPPTIWRGCIDRMLRTARSDSATLLLDRVVAAYGRVISNRQLDTDPTLRSRVEAMQGAYLNRPADRSAHPDAIAALSANLHRGIATGWLGPWATQQAIAWLDSVDIARGWLRGRQVDGATLDQLFAARDETLLVNMTQHLPAPELRAEARRRVIRLHIDASGDPELRSHAAAAEQTVMTQGMNPISTGTHPPLRARLNLPVRQAWVRQQILAGTASVIGSAERRPGLSVLPELPLRGGLEVDVEGLARPLTVCAPAAALDPEPCVAAREITVASPLVTLDDEGVLHFVESLTARQVAQLAREAGQVVIPISVAGHRLVELKWELAFEKPPDLVLDGGPDLLVRVERGPGGRLLESVRANGADYLAVVEATAAASFQIVSSGPDGRSGSAGSDGLDGFAGMSGSSASCPSWAGTDGGSGSDGSDGGAGGDGGNGGDGGSIQVEVACGRTFCADLVALLKNTVRSVGGRGGWGGKGGQGGRGGRGGSGGSGTTCTSDNGVTSLSGGSDGLSGHDGSSGHDGFSGSNGAAGIVSVRVVD